MNDRVNVTVTDHVADARLVRSDKMNALDAAMFSALEEAGARLRAMPGVRAIVLSGDGKAFSAGLDLSNFDKMANGESHAPDLLKRTHGPANLAQHVVLQWRSIPVPVIAAVHGVAFGGGFQLALGADMRIVHPDARMSVMEIQWGLVPDMGGIRLLRDLVRPDVAADLVYGGQIFDGREALALGLATRTSDHPRDAAFKLAAQIANRNPEAIRAAKRLLTIEDSALSERILLAEATEQAALIGRPNQAEAVRAVQERRPPRFED